MVCSGRARKIRMMLEFEGIPDEQFNKVYKNIKRAKYRRDSNIPREPLKTKRHKGEDLESFRERRKKANKRKRENKRRQL